MKKLYIKAVLELLLEGYELKEVLNNLEATLVKRGHQKIRLSVLEGVARELELREGKAHSRITVADQKDAEELSSAIAASLKAIGGDPTTAVVRVDKTITGGYIAHHEGQTIDASYKTKLLKLYRTITQ